MTSIFLGFNLKIAGILVGNYQPPLHIYDYPLNMQLYPYPRQNLAGKQESEHCHYLQHPATA
jgi:hypothetical protein